MKIIIMLFAFIIMGSVFSQKNIDEVLLMYNKNTVPYQYIDSKVNFNKVLLLDAREWEEYEVSHIENAIYVGYSKFNGKKFQKQYPDKEQTIVVYCSLGVRSEDIAEKLQKMGYKNVKNLYGGIFLWKNLGFEVVKGSEGNGVRTDSIHAFSKEWSKYLIKGIKTYTK